MDTCREIYSVLADHQRNERWVYRDFIASLQEWSKIMNFEFKLQIHDLSLCVDYLSRKCLGHFRYGHNGFGLQGEIAINAVYIRERPFWQTLGTLLHELLHSWQQSYGKVGKSRSRNYHNQEFRDKAKSLGLRVDAQGHTQYLPEAESPFLQLLKKKGIEVPVLPKLEMVQMRGTSKLKKWSCGCTNVRVAVADFQARCLKCGCVFKKNEK